MSAERQPGRPRLRAAEVMTVTVNPHTTIAEIAQLFDVAGREDEAIRRLDQCVADLMAALQAKTALGELSPTELRAGLTFRQEQATEGNVS